MEITGSIIKSLPKSTGQSTKGAWTRHQFIIRTEGQYPKDVVIDAYNDKIAPLKEAGAGIGTLVRISFDLSSREHKGNYYTSVNAYKIEVIDESAVGTAKAQPQRASVARQPSMPAHPKRQMQAAHEIDPSSFDDEDGSDLPF